MTIPGIVAAWTGPDGGGVEIDGVLSRIVKTAWRRAVDDWVREARRAPPDCGLAASPVEDLAAWFATDAAGSPSPALASLFDPSKLVAAGVGGRAETVVLGHPVRPTDATPLICLGRPAVRRWSPTAVVRADGAVDAVCVAVGPVAAEPPTIAVHRSSGTTVWQRISGAEAVTAVAAGPGPAAIVDAA
jgi:hypothetical protein